MGVLGHGGGSGQEGKSSSGDEHGDVGQMGVLVFLDRLEEICGYRLFRPAWSGLYTPTPAEVGTLLRPIPCLNCVPLLWLGMLSPKAQFACTIIGASGY